MHLLDSQNPGVGGLQELTPNESAFLMNLCSLNYQQGDILYYNGISLVNLNAGTNGQYLKTQGIGSNPIWSTVSGGGGGDILLASTYNLSATGGLLLCSQYVP